MAGDVNLEQLHAMRHGCSRRLEDGTYLVEPLGRPVYEMVAWPALAAEVEALCLDAARYRWLRTGWIADTWPPAKFPTPPWCIRCELDRNMPANRPIAGDDLDAAVDAAMAERVSSRLPNVADNARAEGTSR